MAFCTHCGREIPDEAVVCVGCGCAVNNSATANGRVEEGRVSAGWFWLGFFFPLIGLILYLVWKDEKPMRSKKCGKGALIGFIVSFVLGVVEGVIMALAGMSQASLLLL